MLCYATVLASKLRVVCSYCAVAADKIIKQLKHTQTLLLCVAALAGEL
jgi:hypothetical protein